MVTLAEALQSLELVHGLIELPVDRCLIPHDGEFLVLVTNVMSVHASPHWDVLGIVQHESRVIAIWFDAFGSFDDASWSGLLEFRGIVSAMRRRQIAVKGSWGLFLCVSCQ
jgi:hypothetical protein